MINKGFIKNRFWNWGLIMGIFNTMIVYGFLQEPDCLPNDVKKLYFKFSHLHQNDLIWRNAVVKWKSKILKIKGIV